MLNLFIDTSTNFLILILEYKQNILGYIYQNNSQKHIDNILSNIVKLLLINKFKLKDINNFYLTIGPGSYTGIKIPITIVKTIKVINPLINVYIINTLIFQAGIDNVISLINAYSDNYYFSVICNVKEIIPSQIINHKNFIKIIKKFPDYKLCFNLQKIDIIKNYIVLKKYFYLVENIFELKPKYLKNNWN